MLIGLSVIALIFPQIAPAVDRVAEPAAGEQKRVTPGEVMYVERSRATVSGVITSAPVDVSWGGAERVNLPAGASLMLVSERGGRIKACEATSSVTLRGVTVNGYRNCLIDNQNDGIFEKAAFNEVTPFSKSIPSPVPYVRGPIEVQGAGVPSARTEILYSGTDGRVLNLTYREFSNGLARPAFTESLTVPLAADFPQQIAVKGHTFTLQSVGGLGLTYQLD